MHIYFQCKVVLRQGNLCWFMLLIHLFWWLILHISFVSGSVSSYGGAIPWSMGKMHIQRFLVYVYILPTNVWKTVLGYPIYVIPIRVISVNNLRKMHPSHKLQCHFSYDIYSDIIAQTHFSITHRFSRMRAGLKVDDDNVEWQFAVIMWISKLYQLFLWYCGCHWPISTPSCAGRGHYIFMKKTRDRQNYVATLSTSFLYLHDTCVELYYAFADQSYWDEEIGTSLTLWVQHEVGTGGTSIANDILLNQKGIIDACLTDWCQFHTRPLCRNVNPDSRDCLQGFDHRLAVY